MNSTYETQAARSSVWLPLTHQELRDSMERNGMRHSELMSLIEDLDAGHVLTADNGRTYRLAQCAPSADKCPVHGYASCPLEDVPAMSLPEPRRTAEAALEVVADAHVLRAARAAVDAGTHVWRWDDEHDDVIGLVRPNRHSIDAAIVVYLHESGVRADADIEIDETWLQSMTSARTYTIGAPVIVTISDDGVISVEVDLSEAVSDVRESEERFEREHAKRDADALDAWLPEHVVMSIEKKES